MNRTECKKIIAVMVQVWKNAYSVGNVETEITVMMRYLGDYSYAEVSAAVDACIVTDTRGFPPTYGQIIDKMKTLKNSGELTATQAWGLVRKCVQGNYDFDNLPVAAQRAVGTRQQIWNWGHDENWNAEVAMSHFVRAYNIELQRQHDYDKMPNRIKALIDATCQNSDRQRLDVSNAPRVTMVEESRGQSVPMPDDAKAKIKELLDA